uniref:plasmid replication initiator TrfA n=1 Tax=Sulfuriferula sp. GW6 TaxID=3345112 RepID=UPI0039F7093F
MAKENNTTSQSEALQRVAQRAEEAKNKAEMEQKQLPLWADWERAMPTSISRSALFAPIGRGRRKRHVDAVIDSRKDVLLTWTGEQLDMGDADVFMQALDLAKTPYARRTIYCQSGTDTCCNRDALISPKARTVRCARQQSAKTTMNGSMPL